MGRSAKVEETILDVYDRQRTEEQVRMVDVDGRGMMMQKRG